MGKTAKSKGQGQANTPPPCQNTVQQNMKQTVSNSNNNQMMNNTGTSMTDILGSSRDLLYGANLSTVNSSPLEIPQHQPQLYANQPPHMSHVNNNSVQTTQDLGQPFVQVINPEHYNGPVNQPFANQNTVYNRPGIPHAFQNMNGPMPQIPHASPCGTDSSIPAWANGLCQQMSSIQIMLDGHAKRWQIVENSITTQNHKLNNMEKQLFEISNLKQELVNTNTKVYQVENEIRQLHTKITDYDETINHYSDKCDDITTNNSATDTKFRNMESRMRSLEQKIDNMDKDIHEANEKLTDVRWRSMRENLLFFGINESDQSKGKFENCEKLIKDFIKDNLLIDKEISLDRVHRLGRYNPRNSRPRPIVAKFTFFNDKELVRLTAPQALSETRFGVSEQFPPEIEEKRKPLYGIAKQARQNQNNRVKLVKDKLYINGELYEHGQTRNNTNEVDTRVNGRRDSRGTFTDTRRQTYRHYDTRTNDQGYMQQPRTFTRSFTRSAASANPRDTFLTSNRFAVLGESTPHRPSRAGKNKATSPLENEGTSKKQYLGDDSSGEETLIEIDPSQPESEADSTQSVQSITQQSPSILAAKNIPVSTELIFQSPSASSIITLQPSPVITLPTSGHERSAEREAPIVPDCDQSVREESA